MFNTPILLIAFNRPTETQKVLFVLKNVKPKELFVAVDAPRTGNEHDQKAVAEVKRMIATEIDWPCEIKTLFQVENKGCGYGPVSALNWFFGQVDAGLILEDDCIPDISFFAFCEELLLKY